MKHESFWMFCAATSASLAVVAGAASAAFAQNRPVTVTGTRTNVDQVSVRVPYGDLNLASAAGERRLDRRVHMATREVCAFDGRPDLAAKGAIRSCMDFAWAGARPQIDRALLRAREIASTGTSAIPAVAITIAVPN